MITGEVSCGRPCRYVDYLLEAVGNGELFKLLRLDPDFLQA